MKMLTKAAVTVLGLGLLGACSTSLSEQDRALISSANQNSQEAKATSQQALEAARAAQADARAANEKADRMFQRSLRK